MNIRMENRAINSRGEVGISSALPANRRTIYCLTACLVFQPTGVSMLFTAFARKISAVGQVVEVFGISAAAFSLAALLAAPFYRTIQTTNDLPNLIRAQHHPGEGKPNHSGIIHYG
jgi:hypothetical protein